MIKLSIDGMIIASNGEVKAVRADWKIQEAIIKVFPFRILFNRRNVPYSICDNFNFYDEFTEQIFDIDTLIDKLLAIAWIYFFNFLLISLFFFFRIYFFILLIQHSIY